MSETGDTLKRLLGGVLLGLGVLIAGASGLCTLYVIGSALASAIAYPKGFLDMLAGVVPLVLMFGGVPIGLGLGLVFAGRRLLRPDGDTENLP